MSGILTFLRNARPNPDPARLGLEDLVPAKLHLPPPFSAGGLFANRSRGDGAWRVQVVVRDALRPDSLAYAEATVRGTPAAVERALRGLALALRAADVAPRWSLHVQGKALGVEPPWPPEPVDDGADDVAPPAQGGRGDEDGPRGRRREPAPLAPAWENSGGPADDEAAVRDFIRAERLRPPYVAPPEVAPEAPPADGSAPPAPPAPPPPPPPSLYGDDEDDED